MVLLLRCGTRWAQREPQNTCAQCPLLSSASLGRRLSAAVPNAAICRACQTRRTERQSATCVTSGNVRLFIPQIRFLFII